MVLPFWEVVADLPHSLYLERGTIREISPPNFLSCHTNTNSVHEWWIGFCPAGRFMFSQRGRLRRSASRGAEESRGISLLVGVPLTGWFALKCRVVHSISIVLGLKPKGPIDATSSTEHRWWEMHDGV